MPDRQKPMGGTTEHFVVPPSASRVVDTFISTRSEYSEAPAASLLAWHRRQPCPTVGAVNHWSATREGSPIALTGRTAADCSTTRNLQSDGTVHQHRRG